MTLDDAKIILTVAAVKTNNRRLRDNKEFKDLNDAYSIRYCIHCGQRLDWSGSDE